MALSSDCYSFEAGEVAFASADLYKVMQVSLDPEALSQHIGTDGTYVIPFELSQGSDSINADLQYLFLIPTVEELTVGFETTGYVDIGDLTGTDMLTVTQTITMPTEDQWNLECTVEVDETVLDEYNAENGFDLELPDAGAYTIEVAPFTEGSTTTEVTITIDPAQLQYGLQALPLRITGTNYSGIGAAEGSETCIIGLNYTVERSELSAIELTLDMLSAYGTADYDGNGLEGLIDGRGSGLMWHGDYAYGYNDPTYGQYIDIALDSSISHFAYSLWTRYENANGAPVTTHIYASTDGSTWHLIGIVSNEFTEGDEEYDSGVFSYREPYNYVRIAVTESNAGSVTATGGYWNCGELEIYGQ